MSVGGKSVDVDPMLGTLVPDPGTQAIGLPQAFVDAGDVPWTELAPLLARQMAALVPGDILELQSGDPETLATLSGWCAGEGHILIHSQPGDGFVSFWIGRPSKQGEE